MLAARLRLGWALVTLGWPVLLRLAKNWLRCFLLVTFWLPLIIAVPSTALGLEPGVAIDQYAHEEWSTKDGLPEGAVLSILEASDGYLWLGTQSALVRFDGHSFTQFDAKNFGVAQYSHALDLLQDRQGALWAAVTGGIVRERDGAFSLFGDAHGLAHPFTSAIVPLPEGGTLVGTGGSGVWLFEEEHFRQHPAYVQSGLPAKINDAAVSPAGTPWIATDAGIVELSAAPRMLSTESGLPSAIANVLTFDSSGQLWVGTRAGVGRATEDQLEITPLPALANTDVTALFEDSDGSIWIGTQEGALHRFAAGQLELSAPRDPDQGAVLAIAEDRHGALWVGRSEGLERYRRGAFVTVTRSQGLSTNRVLAVLPRSAGGLWVLDGTGAVFVIEDGRARRVADPAGVEGEGMLGMVESDDGSLWVASSRLQRLVDGAWQYFDHPGGDFTVLAKDEFGLLVAQTDGNGQSRLSHFDGEEFKSISSAGELVHVQRILRDSQRRIWVTTGGGGIVRLDRGHKKVFTTRNGLPHDVSYGIVEGEPGVIWVATRGGLARIEGDRVFSYAGVKGTPQRSPLQLQLDDLGYLWVTADDGIHRLSLQALNAVAAGRASTVFGVRYSTVDGIGSVEVSWRCSGQAKTPDGHLWYATNGGVAGVDPALIHLRTDPPSPVIESVLIDGREVDTERVDLSEPVDRIEVHYTAPVLRAGDSIEFRYRLRGYDQAWVDASGGRSAHFTGVGAGKYAFETMARRNDGPWSEAASASISVAPPWYETGLARVIFALLLVWGLFLLYSLRVSQLKAREHELLQKVRERTGELQKEIGERRQAEDQVRRFNAELEGNVKERTVQLMTVNQALIEDVQKRQEAEAELADEKERLAVTLTSIAEGVIAVDIDGKVTLINRIAEKYTGHASADAKGQPLDTVFCVVDRETREPLDSPVLRVLDDAGGAARELQGAVLLPKQGMTASGDRLVDAAAAPMTDSSGRLVGAVLVFRDVTERTRAEEQLRKTQKLESLGVLAGGIAHDFNNMLTGIFCHVDMARRTLPEDAPALRWLEDTMTVLDNAKGLARQLLTFASGGQPVLESHSLGELLNDSARFVLSGSHVAAQLDIPDDLWPCDMDPVQIRQVVDNLILNARQAMGDRGTLCVVASNIVEAPDSRHHRGENDPYPRRWVEIAIRDEGPGMPPDVLERIFDPFFTTKATGSGLGLATVHSIATKHGGKIDVESHPGKGTTFRLRLRAASVPSVSRAPDRLTSTPPKVPHARSVLVMDDEYPIRRVAGAALEGAGYECVLTESGNEAVERYRERLEAGRPFDLVILDLTVAGGMGGAEALERLRELNPGVQAIASSGYSAGPVLGDPSASGFNAALPKPYTVDDLLAAVQAMLRAA